MFTPQPVAYIRSPFTQTASIPKGLGARHDTEGTIAVLREFESGLKDIEGFSHLFILWEFDRSGDFDLVAHVPADAGRPHGVFATRSPRRPNPIGLTVVELLGRDGATPIPAALRLDRVGIVPPQQGQGRADVLCVPQ